MKLVPLYCITDQHLHKILYIFLPPTKKESETSQTIRIIPIEINTDTKIQTEESETEVVNILPEEEQSKSREIESQIFSNNQEKTIQLVAENKEKEKAKTIVRKVRQPSANSTKDKLDDFTEKRIDDFTEKRMEEKEDFLAMYQKKSGDNVDDDLDKKNDCAVDDESEDYYSGRFPHFFIFRGNARDR